MKKTILLAAFVAFGVSNAQQSSVKVNPFAYLGGPDLVSYERKVSSNSSLVLSAGYGRYSRSDTKYRNFGVGGQYRYYFKESLKGFYGAGTAEYLNGNIFPKTAPDSFEGIKYGGFGLGARLGYQYIFGSGFTLDLNFGGAYENLRYKYASASEEALYLGFAKSTGVFLRGSVGIGYSF